MPAIPEFVLRKLYVANSLTPGEDGFSFELNNTFAPVKLIGLSLTLDEILCNTNLISISLPAQVRIPVGGISEVQPFNLPVNVIVKIHVACQAPKRLLVIKVDTSEAGILQFAIPLKPSDLPLVEKKQKKASLISRLNRKLQYVNQVFHVQQDPQHPQYHFAPPANWMNDPNGLIYWKGNVHLFYQYNPFEAEWGNIHWGHAVSKDMLHWKHLPIALWPDANGPDAGGCYSGCTVDNNGTPTIIYTGVYPETQCLATCPADDLLYWQKRPDPVIAAPPPDLQLEGFRDPCVWQEAGGEWRMVLGAGLTNIGGAVLIYRSKDLIDWQYLGILYSGNTHQPGGLATGTMWECPSFFPLGDKWVLILSVCGPQGTMYTIYYTGQYVVDRFVPDGPPRLLDYGEGGCLYAPQTFVDRKSRRVLIGWLREARSVADQVYAGWSGTMSLPRLLFLSANGELCSTAMVETQLLRDQNESLTKPNQLADTVRGANLELSIRIPPDTEKWSGVHLTLPGAKDEAEGILIGYDCVNSAVVLDCRHAGGLISAMPIKISGFQDQLLHVFVDGSVVEVFVEDQLPISARFYVSKPQALRVRVVGDAAVDLWKLKL
ncbi:MAG: glycosyl hydrolase family 32 [Chloroflexi bacterium HGW-Chloroflexi-4]|jgi:beta-fructofuranosidase|nr:MAG: glycosyl hydrolase family 32 [Chloroflexi bacterium HGW-Chloroflexi-4]